MYTSSGLSYYRHPDWLGSARFGSTPSRTMYSDVAYAPFGEPYAQAGATDLSFTGINQDTDSDSFDFLFRQYSTQGRWSSPDPAGLAAVDPSNPQSWNRYAYVLNNPLRFIDSAGLDCVYLNNAGDGIESIDTMSTETDCADTGGFWGDGSAFGIGLDPNSNNVDVYTIYGDPNGFIGIELTHNGAYSPGGQTWQAGPIIGSLDTNLLGSPNSLDAALNALHDAGMMAGTAVNGKTILMWYGGSAALGAVGSAGILWEFGSAAYTNFLGNIAIWQIGDPVGFAETANLIMGAIGGQAVQLPPTSPGAFIGKHINCLLTPNSRCHQ